MDTNANTCNSPGEAGLVGESGLIREPGLLAEFTSEARTHPG
jgi:hypothetical protein